MIGHLPEPCPTLQEGLAIGATEHTGFASVFNWIVDVFRNIKNKLPTAVNGRTGNINIVAGGGIDVIAEGNTITIGLGGGDSVDNDNPDDFDPNGGGNEEDEIWQNAEPAETKYDHIPGGGMFTWIP